MTDTTIFIKVQHTKNNKNDCDIFHKHHQIIFNKSYGKIKFESLDKSWKNDQSVYFITAYCEKTKEILGGVKMHVNNSYTELPMIKAAGKIDTQVYDFIDEYQFGECCEIGSLWISLTGFKKGLRPDYLLYSFGALASILSVKTLLVLAMDKSTTYLKKYNFESVNYLGENGKFDYPSEEFPTYFSKLDLIEIDSSETNAKSIISNICDISKAELFYTLNQERSIIKFGKIVI